MFSLKNILNTSLGMGQFLVSKNMAITGSLQSDIGGEIAGRINGDVIVIGKLIIKKEAVINGDITASDIIVSGKIMGDITCSGKLILKSSAKIKGSIRTLEIHIEKDAIVDGIITKTIEAINPVTKNIVSNEIKENNFNQKIRIEPDPETWF